jgi:hypothetical protein
MKLYRQNGMTDEEMFELVQKKSELERKLMSEEDKKAFKKFVEADGKASADEEADPRYNVPKKKPKFTQEEIDAVIGDNEIYSELKQLLNDAQREQVGYGMGKYPESLNDETWSVIETLDHIIGEDIDRLHYLIMLKIKLKKLIKFVG